MYPPGVHKNSTSPISLVIDVAVNLRFTPACSLSNFALSSFCPARARSSLLDSIRIGFGVRLKMDFLLKILNLQLIHLLHKLIFS